MTDSIVDCVYVPCMHCVGHWQFTSSRPCCVLRVGIPVSEVPRGFRPQSSSHLTVIMQSKTQVCTSSSIDAPGSRSSMDICACTCDAKAISRGSRDTVGPPRPLRF